MIAGRCSILTSYHRSFLTNRGKCALFSSPYLLQSPRILVRGTHTQRSSCSCRTRATSSA
jgi:hypothetical protein